jgi:preprotein translocase subunit SecE
MAENKVTGTNSMEQQGKFSFSQVKQFTSEVRNEFDKIAWPDKKHTMASTGVVIVLVIMLSFYLGAVDLILGKLISFILK